VNSPRYESAAYHLGEAFKFAQSADQSGLSNAARESIFALEALLKVVSEEEKSFGDGVKGAPKQVSSASISSGSDKSALGLYQ
jgi:hypothetical protein